MDVESTLGRSDYVPKARVLVVGTDLHGPGGISHLYKALIPHFGDHVDYIAVGTRYGPKEKRRGLLWRLVTDYATFSSKIGRYNVIHLNPSLCLKCFLREMGFILISRWCRKQIIIQFHGWELPFEAQIDKRLKRLFRGTFGEADRILVLAERCRQKLRAWGCTGFIELTTTAIDDSLVQQVEQLRRGQSKSKFTVLFLSRVEKAKGVYEAVDALGSSRKDTIQFILGGDGGEIGALKRYVSKKGYTNVDFPGYLSGDGKKRSLAEADVYLLPSHAEGMPVSVLEAMAVGLPVITTPVGGMKDFFVDNQMGILVSPRDSQAISEAVSRLEENWLLCSNISQFNVQYAQEHFYASGVAGRLMEIYEQTVCKEKGMS